MALKANDNEVSTAFAGVQVQLTAKAETSAMTSALAGKQAAITGDLNVQLVFNRPILELSNLQINTAPIIRPLRLRPQITTKAVEYQKKYEKLLKKDHEKDRNEIQ